MKVDKTGLGGPGAGQTEALFLEVSGILLSRSRARTLVLCIRRVEAGPPPQLPTRVPCMCMLTDQHNTHLCVHMCSCLAVFHLSH